MDVFLTGFSKKLLVAVCIVLVVAMCLTPVEARPPHKTRHNKEERLKNKLIPKEERMKSKALPKNVPLHTMLARKIIKKLKNTRRFFEDARQEVRDSMEHRYGNPKWLPKVKFTEIHNHTYENLNNGMSKKKFEYIVPKLYKSLVQFKLVWERLGNVTITQLDIHFQQNYAKKRESVIRSTLDELFKLLTEIEDDMDKANIPKPHININKLNLEDLQKDNVETTLCLRQDMIAIRAYANTLKKWYWELRCPDDSNPKLSEQCRRVDQALFTKRTPQRNGSSKRHRRQRRHRHFRSIP
ncbi:uncharacterized protein LOC134794226 isoform X2 [Cydia splendana]|uniref:uncharacterized protein LOC134794226 isoform X2 n=1 Tax=Cydia splendana TaxID=1100963 RepID=UPI002131CBCA